MQSFIARHIQYRLNELPLFIPAYTIIYLAVFIGRIYAERTRRVFTMPNSTDPPARTHRYSRGIFMRMRMTMAQK